MVVDSGEAVVSILLGDGDAMTLSIRRLEQIPDWINLYRPRITQVSSYCLPRNLNGKSVEDLARLQKRVWTLYMLAAKSATTRHWRWLTKVKPTTALLMP